jgi:predicted aspartyl protease
MGKVVVRARIANLRDLYNAEQGQLTPDQVRVIEVEDALVDTGATLLSLPTRYVQQLGLKHVRSRQARTSAGVVPLGIHEAVRLTVQGRECTVDVAEIPDVCPILIGQVPLELLDFVVDPAGQQLLGNPDHGGEHMIDVF